LPQRRDLQDAAKFAAEELNDQSVSMAISTAAGSGGALIPENMQNEVIELLSDRTIVRKLGARPFRCLTVICRYRARLAVQRPATPAKEGCQDV
jgi:hypothetical protein